MFSVSPIAATPVDVTATEGQAVVAKFTQPLSLGVLNAFAATIEWGDGSAAGPGQVLSDAAEVTGEASVSNAALSGAGCPVVTTAGRAFSGTRVFTFSDANPAATAVDFTATIDWGGVRTAGTVVGNPDGTFEVLGASTMRRVGTSLAAVTVSGAGGGSVAGASTVRVGDARATLKAATARLTRNRSSTQAVATFTCANPWSLPSDFSAEVFVGTRNRRGSLARVVSLGHGTYAVAGTFEFAARGTVPLRVALHGKGGSTWSVYSTLLIR